MSPGSMMPFRNRGTFGGLPFRSIVLALAALAAAGLWPHAAPAFDARRVEPSVYKIFSFVPEPDGQFSLSSGSGFLVSGRRLVVTNFHVVEGGERVYIAFRDGGEAKLVEARRADSRPGSDLMLLEAREDLPGVALRLGAYEPEKLADVIAIGYPGAANLNKELVPGANARGVPLTDLDSTVTTGVVSRMTFSNVKIGASQVVNARTVQHNAAINPGNSGGPLFDACGDVVGVNTLQGVNAQGLFFSIHASELGRFLREAKVSFAATTRPCTESVLAGTLLPVVVGLSATLALAALAFTARRERALAFLATLPDVLARLPAALPAGKDLALRLFAPVPEGPPPVLCLRPASGGPPLRLDAGGGARTIGRGPGVDILVADDTVSKVHARLAYDRARGCVRITDLGSSNGTYLDGARITEAEAGPGAQVRLGTASFTVAAETPDDAAADAARGWMLSGFDPSGRAVQFELRPAADASGRILPATWTLGRDPTRAGLVIDDASVSALHAELLLTPGEPLHVRDMGSMNGTYLDGESIGTRTVALKDAGQEITFGLARLRLSRLAG